MPMVLLMLSSAAGGMIIAAAITAATASAHAYVAAYMAVLTSTRLAARINVLLLPVSFQVHWIASAPQLSVGQNTHQDPPSKNLTRFPCALSLRVSLARLLARFLPGTLREFLPGATETYGR